MVTVDRKLKKMMAAQLRAAPVVAALSLVSLVASPVSAKDPTLKEVLQRTAAYVAEFERRLSGIISEEQYVQDVHGFARNGCTPATPSGASQPAETCPDPPAGPMRRELRSDLVLARTRDGYIQFRDVFEVDGHTVRERDERVTRLFRGASPGREALKQRILDENARFNIGDVIRNFNTPLVALQFLEGGNQWRFKFSRTDRREPRVGSPDEAPPAVFRVSTEVWTIEYREREPATMIRTPEGRDLPSRGRFWIEPDTGRVLMTELLADTRGLQALVTVSFKSEPLRDMLVPVEMQERYESRLGTRIDCFARYGRFRLLDSEPEHR